MKRHMANATVAIIGVGAMGSLLAECLVQQGGVQHEAVLVCDTDQAKLNHIGKHLGLWASLKDADAGNVELIIIAVPPQEVLGILNELRSRLTPQTLIVSLAAGVTLEQMQEVLPPGTSIARVMPNIPSVIGKGMNLYCYPSSFSYEAKSLLLELLEIFGDHLEVPEAYMNAGAALQAVGPTYLLPVAKALIQAATEAGLSPDQARHIAGQLFVGVGQLMLSREESLDELKARISIQTLDETAVSEVFGKAYGAALTKLDGLQEKLAKR